MINGEVACTCRCNCSGPQVPMRRRICRKAADMCSRQSRPHAIPSRTPWITLTHRAIACQKCSGNPRGMDCRAAAVISNLLPWFCGCGRSVTVMGQLIEEFVQRRQLRPSSHRKIDLHNATVSCSGHAFGVEESRAIALRATFEVLRLDAIRAAKNRRKNCS